MNINLREEETIAYISFYQEYLEEVQRLNKKVTDVLNEVMIESRYDKLQQRISGIIDEYTETIVNKIESGIFATWVESSGSLRSCLRTYRAGEAADEVCAQIEQSIGDLMQDILKIEKADAIITDRPIVSEVGLEQLEDACRNAQTEIQNIKLNYIAQVQNRNDENEIYGTLRPLFEGVAANIESFFEASLNSFVELHEFVRGISVQLHEMVEDNNAFLYDNTLANMSYNEAPQEKEYEICNASNNCYDNELNHDSDYGRYILGIEEIQYLKKIFPTVSSYMAEYEELEIFSFNKNKKVLDSKSKFATKNLETGLTFIGKTGVGMLGNVVLPIPFIGKSIWKKVGAKIGKGIAKTITPIVTHSIVQKFESEHVRTKEWDKNKKYVKQYNKDEEEKIREINSVYNELENMDGSFNSHQEITDTIDDQIRYSIEDFYKERYVNNIQRNMSFKSDERIIEKNNISFEKHQDMIYQKFFEIMSKHACPTITQIETSIFAAIMYIDQNYTNQNIEWQNYVKELNGIFMNLLRAGLEVHSEELGWTKEFINNLADEIYFQFGPENFDLSFRPIEIDKNIQEILGN